MGGNSIAGTLLESCQDLGVDGILGDKQKEKCYEVMSQDGALEEQEKTEAKLFGEKRKDKKQQMREFLENIKAQIDSGFNTDDKSSKTVSGRFTIDKGLCICSDNPVALPQIEITIPHNKSLNNYQIIREYVNKVDTCLGFGVTDIWSTPNDNGYITIRLYYYSDVSTVDVNELTTDLGMVIRYRNGEWTRNGHPTQRFPGSSAINCKYIKGDGDPNKLEEGNPKCYIKNTEDVTAKRVVLNAYMNRAIDWVQRLSKERHESVESSQYDQFVHYFDKVEQNRKELEKIRKQYQSLEEKSSHQTSKKSRNTNKYTIQRNILISLVVFIVICLIIIFLLYFI